MALPTFSILESDKSPALKVFDSRQRSYLIPMLHCLPSMEHSPSSGYAAWNYNKNPGDGNALVELPSTVSPVHNDTALRLFSSQNNGITLTPNGNSFISSGNLSLLGSTQATATVQARRFATAFIDSNVNASGSFQQNTGFSSLLLGSDNTASGSSRTGINIQYDGASVASIKYDGSATFNGSVSKGSGSFRIDHPLKAETHQLVHSFIEGPQADNIYRGKVDLVAGTAAVNIDTVVGMTEGTFAALNREIQCFTTNETGWTAVKGSVTGNVLTITAQDNTCTDTVSWLVIGERHDQHMYDAEWTDDNGKVIVEPEKPAE